MVMVFTAPSPMLGDEIYSDALQSTSFGNFRIRVRVESHGNENVLLYIEGHL